MNLRIILNQYPQCLESRAKLSAILRDLYPSERREINIVLDIYECGIADKIKHLKNIDALQVQAFVANSKSSMHFRPNMHFVDLLCGLKPTM